MLVCFNGHWQGRPATRDQLSLHGPDHSGGSHFRCSASAHVLSLLLHVPPRGQLFAAFRGEAGKTRRVGRGGNINYKTELSRSSGRALDWAHFFTSGYAFLHSGPMPCAHVTAPSQP